MRSANLRGAILVGALLLVPLSQACSSSSQAPSDLPAGSSSVVNGAPTASAAASVSGATRGATSGTASAAASTSAAATGSTTTLFVKETLVDCEGEAPMKCMQIRKVESEPWTYFYDSIEGFKYEESYAYELLVSVDGVDNPPADGSSLRYRLVEVVSKRKVAAPPKR